MAHSQRTHSAFLDATLPRGYYHVIMKPLMDALEHVGLYDMSGTGCFTDETQRCVVYILHYSTLRRVPAPSQVTASRSSDELFRAVIDALYRLFYFDSCIIKGPMLLFFSSEHEGIKDIEVRVLLNESTSPELSEYISTLFATTQARRDEIKLKKHARVQRERARSYYYRNLVFKSKNPVLLEKLSRGRSLSRAEKRSLSRTVKTPHTRRRQAYQSQTRSKRQSVLYSRRHPTTSLSDDLSSLHMG